jgi:cytochrome bd-type quinol oxidase subunit 2
MTAPVDLPVRPTEEEIPGINAHTRARAREDRPQRVGSLTAGTIDRVLNGALSGASVVHAAPPSIMALWAMHRTAAEYYSAGALRWPRLAYGAVHAFAVAPLAYLLVWSGDSPPKLLLCLTVLTVTVLVLTGVI